VFPPHQQKQIRLQLASCVKAVLSQRLMPKIDGNGRGTRRQSPISTAFVALLVDKDKDRDSGRHAAPAIRDADVRSVIFGLFERAASPTKKACAVGDQRQRVQAEGPGIATTADLSRDQMARRSSAHRKITLRSENSKSEV